jgi:hypothetical protein
MLVLTEEAYARATESSPNGNGDGDVAALAEMVDLGSGGVSPVGGAAEFSIGILPSAKLILPILSTRKSGSASG